MGYSVARAWLVLLAAASSAAFIGCGGVSTDTLSSDDVVPALRSLPFRTHVETVTPPSADTAALIGTAKRSGVVVRFSIGIGESPVPVPIPGIGVNRAIGEGDLGFVFTTDGDYPEAFKTVAEWHRAARMATDIEEQLCREVSGEPCPI